MSRWFRLYDDVIHDPKLLKLPDSMRWIWVAMLCIASKNGGTLPPVDDVALSLRVPDAKAGEYITKLVKAKLLDHKDGVFIPHNWDGRQFKSDTSNDRVKRHRENKRNVTDTVTCNVTSSVTDTVTVTAPEQSRADSETEQSRADASAPVDEDLKRRASALGAGISAYFVSRSQPIPNLDRCLLWLSQGYAAGTVLGAVERVLRRGKPVSTLDYFDGAIRDDHAKAAPENLQVVVSKKVFVEEGTMEWGVHQQHLRTTTGKGSPVVDQKDERGAPTGRRGFYFDSIVPEGYDEQTGERLPAHSEDAA